VALQHASCAYGDLDRRSLDNAGVRASLMVTEEAYRNGRRAKGENIVIINIRGRRIGGESNLARALSAPETVDQAVFTRRSALARRLGSAPALRAPALPLLHLYRIFRLYITLRPSTGS